MAISLLVDKGVGVVASPKPCPVCEGAIPAGRTAACSSRCRAERSRRRLEGIRRVLLEALAVVDRLYQPRHNRSARP